MNKLEPLYIEFIEYCKNENLDYVTKKVLLSLFVKYKKGDSKPLFGKFHQLIQSESYKLATIFRDFLNKFNLMEEYLIWEKNN